MSQPSSSHGRGPHGHETHAHDPQGHQAPPPGSGRVLAWLESRVGYSELVKLLLEEPVPGGARWWYVFGSVLTFILTLQLLTGILLASFYSPSSTTAWASVAFIQDQMTMGWFVRGLHSMGASAMVVMTCLHLAQVLLFGAYKAPREMNWIIGVLMMGLVLAFSLTGYLLPWDQKGYWATQVATSIIGTTPVLGTALKKLLQGGSLYGNYTLTHFYTLHTYVLPGSILGLLGLHLYLFRRHGVTPLWTQSREQLVKKTQPFWPDQLFRDILACAAVFLVVVFLVIRSHGADLESPADPASSYLARPEWYFLPLFQLLKYFEGPLEVIGTMVLPGLAGALLIGLPFIDRSPTRDPARRWPFILGGVVGFSAVVMLGLLATSHDRRDPIVIKQRLEALEKADMARKLALQGVPAEGGVAVFHNDPFFRAREIWEERCVACHSLTGTGGDKGPDLANYNSRAWISGFLADPNGRLYMGPARFDKGMKPVEGTPEEIQALTEFVYGQSGAPDTDGAMAKKGEELFHAKDCDACHDIDGTTPNAGPNLKGRGSLLYVVNVITDASQPTLFNTKNKMPKFGGRLSPQEIETMAKFVLSQKK
ncbi:MAG TPA: cytochrome b N-terminal domain-containing protein [Polyangia bacterium]|nr:cytochrome b N-terminal domain-containing protein [Polyangia bacterium]